MDDYYGYEDWCADNDTYDAWYEETNRYDEWVDEQLAADAYANDHGYQQWGEEYDYDN